MKETGIRKGDLYLALTGPGDRKTARPVLILRRVRTNDPCPTVTAARISRTCDIKTILPTHCLLDTDCGLQEPSAVMLERICTIGRKELIKKIGRLSPFDLHRVEMKLKDSLGLNRRRTDKRKRSRTGSGNTE